MKITRNRVQTTYDEPTLTETEHTDSCDINKMVRSAARGQEVRGSSNQQNYGYDDLTMDGLSHRIQKAQTEAELQEIANTQEFDQKELDLIPKNVQEKFKFKVRKNQDPKLAEKNDDKTTNQPPPKPPETPEPPKS